MLKAFVFLNLFILGQVFGTPVKEQVLSWKGSTFSVNDSWLYLSSNESERLEILLDLLSQSTFGRELIKKSEQRARELGDQKDLVKFLRQGETSITDTTLNRQFSPSDPNDVSYSTHSLVYIDEGLSLGDAILDLAHELTHFAIRKPSNPYSEFFDLDYYVESTILGEGGESEAFLSECQVMRELFKTRFNRDKNCLYLNTAEQGSLTQRSLARKLFFQIGKYLSKFHDKLQKFELPKNHFPHTVSDEPAFVSSNYDMPYPMAAVEEYEQIMKKVCANDQRRLTYLEKSYRKNGNRQPASEGFIAEQKKLLRRCKHFL